MGRFKADGSARKQDIRNVFPVADTVDAAEKMKQGEDGEICVTPLEIVDETAKKVRVIVHEAPGFEPDEETITFVPSTVINAIKNETFPLGVKSIVRYAGKKTPEKKNEKTGMRTPYHVFEYFAVKE